MRYFGRSATVLALLVSTVFLVGVTWAESSSGEQDERVTFIDGHFRGDVHTINPDGSGLARLTDTGDAASPKWSPDGTRIAFARGSDVWPPEVDIWVMNADGTEQRILVEDGFAPAWSPDGEQIVFSRLVGDPVAAQLLFVMDADGTNQTQLTEPHEESPQPGHTDPAWSPDGTRIAFADWGFSNPRVYSVASDGSDLLLLNDYGFDPAWSPDASTIAFARFLRLCVGGLWTMDPDGGNARELVKDPADCDIRWPAYSPNGAHIVFNAEPMHPDDPRMPEGAEPLSPGLHIVDADGSNRRFLTEGSQPDWQSVPTVETGAIAGLVTDAVTGQPISGAIVSADGSDAITAADGTYEIESLEPGTYTVSAMADSYQPASQAATVAAGQTTTVDFTLAPLAAPPLAQVDDLLDHVESYELSTGIDQALRATLQAARNQLERGQDRQACHLLRAFLNQVNAMTERQLSTEQAAELRQGAHGLRDMLACDPG